ncbi:arylesterase [Pseudoxanthobacter sp.]|uniref:arylesterase n=1 Tax=Pseudoxanthobacter sp. TaxID=1925742 RepID=UPI002FE163EC
MRLTGRLMAGGLMLAAALLPAGGGQAAEAEAAAGAAGPVTIVALGDSLTAGFGLAPGQGFPARLQAALKARGHDVTVVDAGVSGDTTAGGLARLDWSVGPEADGVIVELGANDALRGQDPARTRDNLDAILTRLAARRLPVLLAGMRAPRNMGADYAARFDALYPELAAARGVALYPFFLAGVAADPALNLPDGLHPTAAGIDIIVAGILPQAEALVAAAEARRAAGP